MPLKSVKARLMSNAQGNSSLEVVVETDIGIFSAAVPYDSEDVGDEQYRNEEVEKAVKQIQDVVAPCLLGDNTVDEADQLAVDELLDSLFGNVEEEESESLRYATYTTSMAVCRSGAAKKKVVLYKHIADLAGVKEFITPVPFFRMLIGGALSDNLFPIRELMIIPTGAKSFHEAMLVGSETYIQLRKIIIEKYGQDACKTNAGHEGGFMPNIRTCQEGLELLRIAIEKAGHTGKIEIGMDVTASEFGKGGKYNLDYKNPKTDSSKNQLTGDQLLNVYRKLLAKYPVVSVEDPYNSDDWVSWNRINVDMKNTQIVGDGLISDELDRLDYAIRKQACDCSVMNVTEFTSVSATITFCLKSREAGFGCLICHRSEDTDDSFIADLVVGLGTGQLKTGAPCQKELRDKHNRILRIEEELGTNATYAGIKFRNYWVGNKNEVEVDGQQESVEDAEKQQLRDKITSLENKLDRCSALIDNMEALLYKHRIAEDGGKHIPRKFLEERVQSGAFDHLNLLEAVTAILTEWDKLSDEERDQHINCKKPKIA